MSNRDLVRPDRIQELGTVVTFRNFDGAFITCDMKSHWKSKVLKRKGPKVGQCDCLTIPYRELTRPKEGGE